MTGTSLAPAPDRIGKQEDPTKSHLPVVDVEHSLALLGLVLMAIVGWLATRAYAVHTTIAGQVGGAIACRAIDRVAVIGWIVDHLPSSTATTNGGMR